jgi:hypothetical protein
MITVIKDNRVNHMTTRVEEYDDEALLVECASEGGQAVITIDIGFSATGHAIMFMHETIRVYDFSSNETWADLLNRIFDGIGDVTIIGKVSIQSFELVVK